MSEIQPITKQLLAAKKARKMTFADFEPILGIDEIVIAAIFYRQATPSMEQACLLLETLGLPADHAGDLSTFPSKGLGPVVPTDPLIYRFYEIMQVYGYPLKDVIQEKFGDGIMSAIDFTMHIEKEENPNGDRVVLTMNGKFLPYKKW